MYIYSGGASKFSFALEKTKRPIMESAQITTKKQALNSIVK